MAANLSSNRRRAKRSKIAKKSGGLCAYCGRILSPETMTFDHIRPRSKGGTNRNHNLAAACESCNNRKGSMTEAEFYKLLRDEKAA